MAEKITTAKEYRKSIRRKINAELWKKVKKLSRGMATDKISAIDEIFKKHYTLPEECIKIAEKLSYKKQPLKVRLQVAKNLVKYENIPFRMHLSILEILAKSNDDEINKIIKKLSLFPMFEELEKFASLITPAINRVRELVENIDWEKFKKAHHNSMVKDLDAVKDERITAILGQVLAEYWLNMLIKSMFQNSQELLKLSFDNKRKILYGLKILKSTTNNDLKKLDDIRDEYAHNFEVDCNKVLKCLKEMDCYNNMEFDEKSEDNDRIKKCAIKLVRDLMDIEETFIIEVNKKKK